MLIAGRCSDLTGLAGLAQPDLETIFVDQLVSLDDPAAEATPAPWRVAPDATATILHTSGTTGLPKRVPRAHATFVAAARAEGASSGLTPRDVLLLATGPHTKAGQANMFGALLSGGSCVVVPRFEPECLPGWLADHQPTWMFATAAQLNFLLDALVREGHQLHLSPRSRLRLIRTGSQPMTPGTLERAERMLGATVLDGYGMSEVSCIAASGPHAVDRREGSCGRPWAAEVRIVAESDLDHLPGNAGEIVVRGPTLFSGYLDDPAANAAAFLPGGWFRTGDLGFLDREGYLYLTGRRSEIINRGGEKIAPLEVDQALLCHPAVAAAASFSVPDDRLGEDLIAAVVVRAGTQVTARDLRAAMLDRLSPFKVPHRIWFVPDLPRTSTGKVQRQALARLWEEQRRARGEPGSG
jgi:acyl-CoA synthetase (AMP-forming)/AMP-acid ligase II